jgi:hypothetical protein
MPTCTQQQWDLLAPVWHNFEQAGTNADHLCRFAAELQSPAVVLGSGLGPLTKAIQECGIMSVIGADWSPEMARFARIRRGVSTVVASAELLPFADGSLQSVVCATGVINPQDSTGTAALINEVCRVATPGSSVVMTFFVPSIEMLCVYSALGLMTHGRQHSGRIVELWRVSTDRTALAELISGWTGNSAAASLASFEAHEKWLAGWFTALDAAKDELQQSGNPDPAGTLAGGFAWDVCGWTGTELPASLQDSRFEITDDWTDERACTRYVVARVRPYHNNAPANVSQTGTGQESQKSRTSRPESPTK